MSKLVLNYNKGCMEQDKDNRYMDKYCYKEALIMTLMDLSLEDMREHGRLLLLKDKLVNMVDRDNKLSVQELGLFQLKDYCNKDFNDLN